MNARALRRFDRFVERTASCWLWRGWTTKDGYGRSPFPGMPGTHFAHRVSYEHFVGPIAEGLHLDHLCRVRNCVNPAHLEPVTCKENIRRGNTGLHHRRKTHCPHGHPYDAANTYVAPDRSRSCRTCARERAQRAASVSKAVLS